MNTADPAGSDPGPREIHVDLSGPPETMLAILYARALDADAAHPILGDAHARDLVRRIDYDWDRTGLTARNAPSVTIRAAHFDGWAREFLAVHDEATAELEQCLVVAC